MKKSKISILLAVACVFAVVVGSMAFFTDRVEAKATATAGTLDLTMTEITRSAAPERFKPGTGIKLTYTLANAGNKSADVLETLVLTTPDVAQSAAEAIVGELELYAANDVTLDTATGAVTVNSGARPIGYSGTTDTREVITSGNSTKIIYKIDEFILNGSGENAEAEAGVSTSQKSGSYVLVFSKTAGNDFAGITMTLDYEAQAKQHRNTNEDTWKTIQTSVDFADIENYKAVLAKDQS